MVAVGRENITINISQRLEGLLLKGGVIGGKGKRLGLFHAGRMLGKSVSNQVKSVVTDGSHTAPAVRASLR